MSAAAVPVAGSPKHPAALSPQANASVALELGSDETPEYNCRNMVVSVRNLLSYRKQKLAMIYPMFLGIVNCVVFPRVDCFY